MTEDQYLQRRKAIMQRVRLHEDTFADGRPKFPRSLAADLRALRALDQEYHQSPPQ